MGWGCYRHECDAGSEKWKKKIHELSQAQLDGARAKCLPYTWGRDMEICPWCWEERERLILDLMEAIDYQNETIRVMSRHLGRFVTVPNVFHSQSLAEAVMDKAKKLIGGK